MVWGSTFGFRHELATAVGFFLLLRRAQANTQTRIVSQILSGDSGELKGRAKAIEQDKEAPSKAHLAALKDYCSKSVEEQETIRQFSGTDPQSTILSHPSIYATLVALVPTN